MGDVVIKVRSTDSYQPSSQGSFAGTLITLAVHSHVGFHGSLFLGQSLGD